MGKSNYIAQDKLEARIVFILMKAGVTGPEIDECMQWAFGPDPWHLAPYPGMFDRWHKLHPEFPAKKSMSAVEWFFVVGTLFLTWKKHKQNDEKV